MRIPLALALCASLLGGCRHPAGPVDSGEQRPDDRAPELGLLPDRVDSMAGELRRRLALIQVLDPTPEVTAQRRRIRAALAMFEKLQRLGEGQDPPRDQERAAVRAYAAFVETVVASEQYELPAGEVEPAPDEVAGAADPAMAIRMHGSGDLDGALAEGQALIDSLRAAGVESLSLLYLVGIWALEAGEPALAEEQFLAIVDAEGMEADLVERATAKLGEARAALLGPDAAALADAKLAFDQQRLAHAWDVLQILLAAGTDAEVGRQAEALLLQVTERCEQIAWDRLARAEALLSGPGPYQVAGDLLDAVRELPEGTWDAQEELRLRAWYRGLTRDAGDPQVEAGRAEQDALLAEARGLVAAADYRAALERFARLEGTPHQAMARREASAAADSLVKEERERAGRLFVAAKKRPDRESRVAGMVEVRGILAGLLAEFPDSGYAERVRANLVAVEQDLAADGWQP